MKKTRPKRGTLAERFWHYVDKRGPDECWLWLGSLNYEGGYGRIYTGKGPGGTPAVQAHRFSYQINVGPVPRHLFVCHRCDNPGCVNPAHLFVGTHDENMADMVAKKRSPRGGNPHVFGTRKPNAKLTESQVLEIRESNLSNRAVAKVYGIGATTARNIRAKKKWAHLHT